MQSKRLTTVLVSFFMLVSLSQFAVAAGTDQMKTMAKIMLSLKHFPDPKSKEVLKGVVDNTQSSGNEKVLAQAMINLEHTVNPADKPKLQTIIDDKAAAQNDRDLAGIILNLNHRPTDEDKAKLEKMM